MTSRTENINMGLLYCVISKLYVRMHFLSLLTAENLLGSQELKETSIEKISFNVT